jgi:hypothetical protein
MAKRLAMENNGSFEPIINTEVLTPTLGGTSFRFSGQTNSPASEFEASVNNSNIYNGFKLNSVISGMTFELFKVSSDGGGYIDNPNTAFGFPNAGGYSTTDWINPVNGVAQGWNYFYSGATNSVTPSITSGNGFIGNAQRLQLNDTIYDCRIRQLSIPISPAFKNIPLKFSVKYRTSQQILFVFYNGTNGNYITSYHANTNTGSATLFVNNDNNLIINSDYIHFEVILCWDMNSGDYFEIDEINLSFNPTHIISWGTGTSKITMPYGVITSTINASDIISTSLNTSGITSTSLNTGNIISTSLNTSYATATTINANTITAPTINSSGVTISTLYCNSNIRLNYSAGIINTTNTNFVWNDTGSVPLTYSVAIGWNSRTTNYNGVAIGRDSFAGGNTAAAFGYYSKANQAYTTAIGYNSIVNNTYSTALGTSTTVSASYSTAIGYGSTVTASNEMRLGSSSTTVKLGNGTTVTSDKRDKTDITENELGLDFINSVSTFKWKDNNRDKYFMTKTDDETGAVIIVLDENNMPVIDYKKYENAVKKGKRWHRGVVAQDILSLIDSTEFSAVKDTTINNNFIHLEELTIDYNQFIAPIIKSIQELSSKVEELEKENKKLKEK